MSSGSMTDRTVVITGGTSGLGEQTAAELASLGARVILTARRADRGAGALARLRERVPDGNFTVMDLDLASLDSVRTFADALARAVDQLHVLVNNAGGLVSKRSVTTDGFETTFGVNHLGHFALTHHLRDLLVASAPARVVAVASVAHRLGGPLNFDDLQSERHYTGWIAYCRSKLANVCFAQELARRLDGTGVTSNCLHPGYVRTEFGVNEQARLGIRVAQWLGRPFMVDVQRGAQTSVFLASAPTVGAVSGRYFVRCRPHRPSHWANADAARRLWTASEQLTGCA